MRDIQFHTFRNALAQNKLKALATLLSVKYQRNMCIRRQIHYFNTQRCIYIKYTVLWEYTEMSSSFSLCILLPRNQTYNSFKWSWATLLQVEKCFSAHVQSTPCTRTFSEECFRCVKPNTDLWIIKVLQKAPNIQGWTNVFSTDNKNINKEQHLNCTFGHFSNLSQKI